MFVTAGSLVREFKHLAVDMFVIEEDGKKKLQVEAHFGKRKALASIRTVCSHVTVSRHSTRVVRHTSASADETSICQGFVGPD